MPRFEVLLPIGVLAFYLYDCLLPLYGNEVLFVKAGRAWRVVRASPLVIGGRRICALNPLLPHQPAFRVALGGEQLLAPRGPVRDPAPVLAALRAPGMLALLLLATLVVAVPVVSLGWGAGVALLVVFAVAYGLAIAAVIMLFARRTLLGLATRDATGIALDALLCPPFGVNLPRKVTLRWNLGDAVAFVRGSFDAPAREQFRVAFLDLVRSEAAGATPEDPVSPERARCLSLLEDAAAWR